MPDFEWYGREDKEKNPPNPSPTRSSSKPISRRAEFAWSAGIIVFVVLFVTYVFLDLQKTTKESTELEDKQRLRSVSNP